VDLLVTGQLGELVDPRLDVVLGDAVTRRDRVEIDLLDDRSVGLDDLGRTLGTDWSSLTTVILTCEAARWAENAVPRGSSRRSGRPMRSEGDPTNTKRPSAASTEAPTWP
jgi:hypothetical protein